MLLNNSQATDPIVEILRLAYRRGLVIRQEQEEIRKAANVQSSNESKLNGELKELGLAKRSRQKSTK
jgi:hypothetical protein